MKEQEDPYSAHFIELTVKYVIWHYWANWAKIKQKTDFDINTFPSLSKEELIKLRFQAFTSTDAVFDYLKEDPYHLTDEDRELSKTFVHAICGQFFIISVLKDSMHLLYTNSDNESYILKVYPTSPDFLYTLRNIGLPRYGQTVLFPCNGRIIYDSLDINNISFGTDFRASVNTDAKEARAKFGVIKTLPIKKQSGDPDMLSLRGYTANKKTINGNWETIWQILDRKPDYKPYFYKRMGMLYTRERRNELKGEGIVQGWFALIGWKLITGGKTREIAEEAARGIVPPEKIPYIHYFEINDR